MTTKTITIQKKGIIVLPREWLQKINQENKLKACFVNGNIVLSRMENEEVCISFNQNLDKTVPEVKKEKIAGFGFLKNSKKLIKPLKLRDKKQSWFWTKEWGKKEKQAEKDIKSKKITGPFENAEKLIKDLKS
ncbi:MAG: hypothetical protein ABH808_00280 [Candidatus Kuenenbacteria bacterium]